MARRIRNHFALVPQGAYEALAAAYGDKAVCRVMAAASGNASSAAFQEIHLPV